MTEKIDKYIFDFITQRVRSWVKKQKYTKHKYDFYWRLHFWEIAFWLGSIILGIGRAVIAHHLLYGLLLQGFLFSVVMLMSVIKVHSLWEVKNSYDWLWQRRKDPLVYQMVKTMCENSFERGRRTRRFMLRIQLVLFGITLIANPILSPIYLMFVAYNYESSIFDFDEPEKKEKKATEKLSDLLTASWQALIGPMAPARV